MSGSSPLFNNPVARLVAALPILGASALYITMSGAGAAGSPALLGGVAGAAVAFLNALAAGIAASDLHMLLGRIGQSRELRENHEIARVAGEAMAEVIRAAAGYADFKNGGDLVVLAKRAPERWLEIVKREAPGVGFLGDAELAILIRWPSDPGEPAAIGDAKAWTALLKSLALAQDGLPAVYLGRGTVERLAVPRGVPAGPRQRLGGRRPRIRHDAADARRRDRPLEPTGRREHAGAPGARPSAGGDRAEQRSAHRSHPRPAGRASEPPS
jgi:hypothetical protein